MNVKPLHQFGVQVEGNKTQRLTRNMLRELRHAYSLVLLRGFEPPSGRKDLLDLCAEDPQKELLHWNFGPVMEMKEDESSPNYLFSNEAVPFHWDGAFHLVPSWLVFFCVQAPPRGCGGQTLFTDTTAILGDTSSETKTQWENISLSYSTKMLAHYGGKISQPLIQKHAHRDQLVMRFAEPVRTERNPVQLEVRGLPPELDQERFIEAMKQKIYDPRYCYEHEWQQGDLLIADNHALIHGRRGFNQKVPRHLRRIQIL